jgi:drug/metabolite transporter (DMT)-like permease
MILNLFILLTGVFACSVSVIFIKLSTEHPLLLASYRLFVAAVVLTPLLFRDLQKNGIPFSLKLFRPSLLPGVTLCFHFIAWIVGARMTLAAHSTLIVNMVPVVMPFFLFLFSKELINRWEILGTALAITGVSLLGGMDLRFSRETFNGDLVCFFSMVLFALYLTFARKNRNVPGIWIYLVPLYYTAGFFCLGISLFFINPVKTYTTQNIFAILGLGIVSTVAGHSALNYSMKHFRGQTVSILNLGEFIFAGIMGYLLLGEVPRALFYISGLLVSGGAAIVILRNRFAE